MYDDLDDLVARTGKAAFIRSACATATFSCSTTRDNEDERWRLAFLVAKAIRAMYSTARVSCEATRGRIVVRVWFPLDPGGQH